MAFTASGGPHEYLDTIYEKCARCPLFIDSNESFVDEASTPNIAQYVHSERGDSHDEHYLDVVNPHDAEPSGLKATLRTWMLYGPEAMRERFFVGGEGEGTTAPALRS